MRRLPSLNALRAFEAVARLGKMTAAADELYVTHGAVSRQVKLLEEQLGLNLFEGSRQSLVLSEAGRRLLPSLTNGLDRIDQGIQDVVDLASRAINVSCLGTLYMRWLIPKLYRFKKRHPGIELRLSADHGPVDFSRQNFDVAIRVSKFEWPEDARVVHLFSEAYGPVLAPCDELTTENAARILAQYPKLHTKTRPDAWTDWSDRSRLGYEAKPDDQVFEHFYFMLEAAVSGLGVAIAPWPLVMDDIAAKRLVAPFGFVDSGKDYVAVIKDRHTKNAGIFCDWLASEGAALPAAPVLTD